MDPGLESRPPPSSSRLPAESSVGQQQDSVGQPQDQQPTGQQQQRLSRRLQRKQEQQQRLPEQQQEPSQQDQQQQQQQQQQQHHQHQQPQPEEAFSAAPHGRFTEEWDASQRGSSLLADGPAATTASTRSAMPSGAMQRSSSLRSFAAGDDRFLPVRSNTLKKRASMRRGGGSRRSNRAGSVRSLAVQQQSASDPEDVSSAFYCPVPTSGTPTDVLANRFQVWRKVLKDVISYFREIQSHYEQRSKSLLKLVNIGNNIATPPNFLSSAGIDDALQLLRKYNTAALQEATKAKEIEDDVILALTGLRSDLQQKIKEIRHLAGDFKNSVDREIEGTQKAVRALADALEKNEVDSAYATGKQDPYLLRLAVDQQVERQIDEENYLHQAYLNLEGSGRELESIVVGEIQKAYNAYAGILKREADNAYGAVEELRDGPIAMPKDQEWIHFVTHDDQIIDPTVPMRSADQIQYPGQDHMAAQEIRAGLLERKSKYLKSYTAGWYVLSATHLHEFKSADKTQPPVMSLYLPEQKLGSHSTEGGSSNKFVLKGRQTGAMHRGHTWVFRAESHDTMIAWYEDIQALTEKTAEERSQFVRTHSRSLSRSSRRSASSDGIVDEDDDEPFSANQMDVAAPEPVTRRPEPGGRFPSDMQTNAQRGGLQSPPSPSSVTSARHQEETLLDGSSAAAAAGGLGQQQGNYSPHVTGYGRTDRTPEVEEKTNAAPSPAAMAPHSGKSAAPGNAGQDGGGAGSPDAASHARHEPGGLGRGGAEPEERPVSDGDRARYMDERKMIDAEVEAYVMRLGGGGGGSTTSASANGLEKEAKAAGPTGAGSTPTPETQPESAALQPVAGTQKVGDDATTKATKAKTTKAKTTKAKTTKAKTTPTSTPTKTTPTKTTPTKITPTSTPMKTTTATTPEEKPAADKSVPQRPAVENARADSAATLSSLAIPGKFPRGGGGGGGGSDMVST